MRRNWIRFVLFSTLCICLAATAAVAEEGWKLKAKSVEKNGKETLIHITIGAEHVKFQVQGERQEAILGPKGVTTIDHANEQTLTITYDQMKGMAEQLQGAGGADGIVADAMKQALEKMDPKDRAQAEKYMKMNVPGMRPAEAPVEDRFEIEPAGDGGTIADLDVMKYVIKKNGKRSGLAWLADAIDVEAIIANVGRLAEVAPDSMRSQSADLDLLRQMRGFPAKLEDLENGTLFELLEAERTKIASGTWNAPSNYKPAMGMAPSGG